MSIYSDINEYHDKNNKDKNKKKNVLEDEGSVYQSVNNILSTVPGERLFNPEFGTKLDDVLFEINDSDSELIIFDIILEAIEKFDSRIDFDMEETKIERNIENNKLELTLSFKIQGLEDQNFKTIGILGK